MVEALLSVLKYALSIGDTVLRRRYLDRVIKLEKLYYEESNKPEAERNHAFMDNIDAELRIIAKAVTSFGKSDAKNK